MYEVVMIFKYYIKINTDIATLVRLLVSDLEGKTICVCMNFTRGMLYFIQTHLLLVIFNSVLIMQTSFKFMFLNDYKTTNKINLLSQCHIVLQILK